MAKDVYKVLEENILENGNRPIFFIGSGMSIRYLKGPNWLGLLKKLIINIENSRPVEYYLQKYSSDYEKIAGYLSEIYFEQAWMAKDDNNYEQQFFLPHKYKKDIFAKHRIYHF